MATTTRANPLLRATNALILINAIAFVWELATGALTNGNTLVQHGALYGPLVAQGEWWRIVTGAFLHGGLLHIALNMFALYQVGLFLEVLLGAPRMLIVYAVSLLGGGIAVVLFNFNEVTVGASGAIFGIFGALVAIGLRLGKRGRGLVSQTLPIIVINLALTFTIPNISAAGHIGGLVAGFLAGLVLIMMHQAGSPAQAAAAYAAEGEVAPAESDEPSAYDAHAEPVPAAHAAPDDPSAEPRGTQ